MRDLIEDSDGAPYPQEVQEALRALLEQPGSLVEERRCTHFDPHGTGNGSTWVVGGGGGAYCRLCGQDYLSFVAPNSEPAPVVAVRLKSAWISVPQES